MKAPGEKGGPSRDRRQAEAGVRPKSRSGRHEGSTVPADGVDAGAEAIGGAGDRPPGKARSADSLDPALEPFHPVLARWFADSFGTPTDAQRSAWSSILGGAHTLLAAPTGSGKTLAALLPCLDRLLRAKEAAFSPDGAGAGRVAAAKPAPAAEADPGVDPTPRSASASESASAPDLAPASDSAPAAGSGKAASVWRPGVRVLYVTPLKALNNDIYDHVTEFVAQIAERMEQWSHQGVPGITCAVRTGDTPSSKRAAMLRRPPDVLVTTPESLFILLGSDKGRLMLQTAEQIIVDEIHDLAADKRGSHLSLTLERLEAWRGSPLQRIGLSATQKPMERVARFLGGWAPPKAFAAEESADLIDAGTAQADPPNGGNALAGIPDTANARAGLPDAGTAQTVLHDAANAQAGLPNAVNAQAVLHDAAPAPIGPLAEEASAQAEPLPAHPLGYVPRPVAIIESAMAKTMDVLVTMPGRVRLGGSRDSVWFPIMDRLLQLMEGCRSVLVFVNSRRMAERLCLRLNDYTGQEMCRAHHGSMDRGRRLEVERLLKEGRLRCIVATSSLELGIDVGHVDLVVQLDSPLSAAAGIQRIGRAGHGVGEASRGIILARQRGVLPEIAVLARMIAERDIDPIEVPRHALDVLSQQAVAIASLDTVPVEEMYRLILGSDSYRAFPRQRLLDMLAVLAGLYPFARPLLEWDREANAVGPRPNSRMAAVTGAGTIPQSGAYPVHHADSRSHVGELDEEFVQESRVGDVFQLGTSSWMISSISKDRVYVKETGNRFSEIPFWRNEAGSRSYRLGERVAQLWTELMERLEAADAASSEAPSASSFDAARVGAPAPADAHDAAPTILAADAASHEAPSEMSFDAARVGAAPALPDGPESEPARPKPSASGDGAPLAPTNADESDAPFSAAEEAVIRDLQEPYRLDDRAARSLVSLVRAQRATGVVPTAARLAVEVYKDIAGQTHIVIHNAWGRRVNRTLQLAIERKFETSLPHRLYGNAKDNGIEFVLPEWDPSWLQAVRSVTPDNLRELLVEALPGSPLLAVAFRRIAETSLLLKRSFGRTPMWQLRLRGEELLRAALPYADRFPYLGEAMRECLRDYLDEPRLKELLGQMQEGRIAMAVHYRDLPSPLASQFAADYVNMRIYEGDGLDRAVQAQLLQMSRELAGELFGQEALRGAVDPQVLEAERRRLETPAAGAPGSADELYRLLKQRGDLTEAELLGAADADPSAAGWLRQLRQQRRVAGYEPGGGLAGRFICADEAELYGRFPQEDDAASFVVERWIAGRLAFTPEELAARYPALGADGARSLIPRLLEADRIQLAPFAEEDELLYTSALTAARVVRLSVQAARGRSEAADAVRWCRLLAGRQHALQGTQLQGEHGLLRVLEQLQGFFFPLSYWESFLLPSRLASYRPEELDLLCASGEVLWLGRQGDGEKEGKIAFFLPESRDLIASWLPQEDARPAHPQLLERLKRGGAMFLAPLARELGRQPSEVQAELLELVWQGQVSNDQFAPLRGPSSASRSRGSRSGRGAWGGSGLGRWFWTGSLRPPQDSGSHRPQAAASTGLAKRSAAEPSASTESGLPALRSGPSASNAHHGDGAAPAAGSLPQDGSPALRWIDRLLDVYGIVSRDLAAAMSPCAWDELLPALKRLEEWGVLVRGQLIEGVPAMQFTTREIAESLRQPLPGEEDGLTVLSAADPANPFGLLADWPGDGDGGFARKPGNFLVLEDGEWRFWVESNGRRIRSLGPKGEARDEAPAAASLQQALASIAARQGLAKIAVEQWNGRPVDETPAAEALRGLGAERDRHRFVLWKSQLSARR